MKIAIHVDGPIIRGNEQQLLVLAGGLVQRGHEVVASCRSDGPVDAALRERGIATTAARPRGDADVYNALRFARWLRGEHVDAVLLTSWVRAFVGGWAAHVARVPRVIFRIGGIQPIHRRDARTERHALRKWYHTVIASSSTVAKHMTAALPELRDRLVVVPNGIAPVDWTEPVPLRAQLSIPDDALVVVAVGGLENNKGFDVLIEAVPLTDRLHVVLVGGGTPEQKRALTGLAQMRGVFRKVHFLGRRADIHQILAACDIFVLASRSEGFSVALLEGMMAGLPIVATDVGAAREALTAHSGRPVAGWIVARGDAGAMAERLNDVAGGIRSSDGRVPAAATEAAWRVRHWYTDERMITGYEAVLEGRPLPPPPTE